MLHIKHNDTFLCVRPRKLALNLLGNLDQLFALA
jgi:hypothetical protein